MLRTIHLFVLSAIVLSLANPSNAATIFYRIGVGAEEGRTLTLTDVNCASTQPPALFGCGAGSDGRPFGARGELAPSIVYEGAVGRALGKRARIELAYAHRPNLDIEAESNFTGVAPPQPV